jgi:hypothetical protein
MLELQKAIVAPQLLYGCDNWTFILTLASLYTYIYIGSDLFYKKILPVFEAKF